MLVGVVVAAVLVGIGVVVLRQGGQDESTVAEPGDITLSSTPLPAPEFPIRVGENGRTLVDAEGDMFHGLFDTGWNALTRMTRDEFTDYAETRREQGYTGLLLSVLDFSTTQRTEAVGGTPFTEDGSDADLSRPRIIEGDDNDHWDHVEWAVDELERLGLVAVLVPNWHQQSGGSWRGHLTDDSAVDYGEFLAERLGDRSNVWWMLGGDNRPKADASKWTSDVPRGLNDGDVTQEVNLLAESIKDNATVPQLMTYHTDRRDTAWTYFGEEEWYDLHAAYSGIEGTARRTLPEYERDGVKPVFLVEGLYDRPTPDDRGELDLSREQLRRQAWSAFLGGAVAVANGHELVWPVEEGWQDALQAPSAKDLTLLSEVLATYQDSELVPDLHEDADPAGRSLLSGYGTGDDLGMGAVSTDKKVGITYLPSRRERVIVNLDAYDGIPELAWLHPGTGELLQIDFDTEDATLEIATPEGWTDAVLIADVRN